MLIARSLGLQNRVAGILTLPEKLELLIEINQIQRVDIVGLVVSSYFVPQHSDMIRWDGPWSLGTHLFLCR